MIESLKKALLPFLLCFFVLLVFPSIIPQVRLLAFVPFLTFCLAKYSFPGALWLSLISGLTVDLYSNSSPLGFFALNYTLTSIVVFKYRSYFSEEKAHVFSLYSVLYSFVSTSLHFILFALLEMQIKLHFFSLITDLLLLPILDGVYALAWVFFPLAVIEKAREPARVKRVKYKIHAFRYKFLRRLRRIRNAR